MFEDLAKYRKYAILLTQKVSKNAERFYMIFLEKLKFEVQIKAVMLLSEVDYFFCEGLYYIFVF